MKQLGACVIGIALLGACGDNSEVGPAGPEGPQGPGGQNGEPGEPGEPGVTGGACRASILGDGDTEGVPSFAPLSSMVAISFCDAAGTGTSNVAEYVKALVERYAADTIADDIEFPLAAAATDQIRAIEGLVPDIVARWMDPLTWSGDVDAPRFGANADYIGYFGDGWQTDGSPLYAGSDTGAWVWVNHEYVSNARPGAAAPTGQHRTLARFLGYWGVIDPALATTGSWDNGSLTVYQHEYRKQVGGSWFHIIQDPATGDWQIDRNMASIRYDATDDTLTKITGLAGVSPDHDDTGAALPANVAVGTNGNCAGSVTPWGTILAGEENVQDAYGDVEPVWSSDQKLTAGPTNNPSFLAGNTISFPTATEPLSEFGSNPDPNGHHARDLSGYLVEIDVGVAPGEYYGKSSAGVGHQKLGSFGRARWENAVTAVGDDWNLVPGQKIVIYSGNDRRGGHIYKWVSAQPYVAGMTKVQIRNLLADGYLYVAHFDGLAATTGRTMASTGQAPTEDLPGAGRWIELSLTSTDIAPNAAALGAPTKTVGEALADANWNRIGAFASDDDVLRALFTASLKVGVAELNRPEDLEWNPLDASGTPRLYVAFTNHNRKVALDQQGRVYDPAVHATSSPARTDKVGSIFAIEEDNADDPAQSDTFSFFMVWSGTAGTGAFDASCPDNVLIDADGGVWFGTDGNFGVNHHADAVYYLDLDPAHKTTTVPTYGKAFRVAAGPSDAEMTGPVFSSAMGTMFFDVQHPGEEINSSWPAR